MKTFCELLFRVACLCIIVSFFGVFCTIKSKSSRFFDVLHACCQLIIYFGDLMKNNEFQYHLSITLINNFCILKLCVKRTYFLRSSYRGKAVKWSWQPDRLTTLKNFFIAIGVALRSILIPSIHVSNVLFSLKFIDPSGRSETENSSILSYWCPCPFL